jgi:hypothetical protein
MPSALPLIVAQQIAGSAREFSQATMSHAMSSEHGPLDIALVALGVVVVIVTTIYSLLLLIRPGERDEAHIKRRILDDGTRGSR